MITESKKGHIFLDKNFFNNITSFLTYRITKRLKILLCYMSNSNLNQNHLVRQEKIELLKRAIGENICFLCHRTLFFMREGEKNNWESVLPLCLKCYDRYQILRSLEEKCDCDCEKCKC